MFLKQQDMGLCKIKPRNVKLIKLLSLSLIILPLGVNSEDKDESKREMLEGSHMCATVETYDKISKFAAQGDLYAVLSAVDKNKDECIYWPKSFYIYLVDASSIYDYYYFANGYVKVRPKTIPEEYWIKKELIK